MASVPAHSLARPLTRSRAEGDDSYYAAATEAEAELVLGRPDAAVDAIARAVARNDGDYGALTTTRRQLRLVCQATGTDPAVLAPLGRPVRGALLRPQDRRTGRGRAPSGRAPSRRSPLRSPPSSTARPVGYAYGALAAGADILWAEALLARGSRAARGAAGGARGVRGGGRSRPPAPGGSSASAGVWRRRRPSSTPPTTRWAAMTSCSATGPSWRWGWRCCAGASSTLRSGSSAYGIAAAPTARPGRRST